MATKRSLKSKGQSKPITLASFIETLSAYDRSATRAVLRHMATDEPRAIEWVRENLDMLVDRMASSRDVAASTAGVYAARVRKVLGISARRGRPSSVGTVDEPVQQEIARARAFARRLPRLADRIESAIDAYETELWGKRQRNDAR